MIEDLREIQSWAGLERYIEAFTGRGTDARSFIRLAKDSIYAPLTKRFEFSTCHPQLTTPRMRNLKDSVGISFKRESEIDDYHNVYFWKPRNKFGDEFEDTIIRLKRSKDPFGIKRN